MRWLVDAMNVIGSRPDGWWRDRDGAKRQLVEELERWAENSGNEATVFIDGTPVPLPELDRIEVRFAPGGPNAADRAIEEYVRGAPRHEELRVVTSDRPLSEAVRTLGADVSGAGEFRRRIDA